MARVTVYKATKYDSNNDQTVSLRFMGTREALRLASLTPVEGSCLGVDESELDENWFYHPE